MDKPKLARIYYGGPDEFKRWHYHHLHVVTDGVRAKGPVLSGQGFFTTPPDVPAHVEYREFDGRNGRAEEADAAAKAWLTEGIVLAVTCKHCGMAEEYHADGQWVHKFQP